MAVYTGTNFCPSGIGGNLGTELFSRLEWEDLLEQNFFQFEMGEHFGLSFFTNLE